ncbi:hypothetical protein PGTUg99_035821 [Puccinia graminis f. sp. tritici]|uniref:Uncharacterized protein n=1 Tax=Puccinia graminis f. sp. tritici TaxID=56615 RepID=A0A5B0MIP7_PUCGR|nr:hypothetical protein PGTUg99_035821 [Puccinia graminis f. sp. tritici]
MNTYARRLVADWLPAEPVYEPPLKEYAEFEESWKLAEDTWVTGREPFLASSGHAEQAADGSGGGPKLPSAATFGSFGIPSSKLP